MRDFLKSIFKTSEERIKNPVMGSFMTSWVIFNWKPIFLLMFSSRIIEDKINYIEQCFSNIWNLLWCPLISTLLYLIALPYINLTIEILLNFSQSKRTNLLINKQKLTIESQKQLAIEEIKLEEAKSEFRERNTHNKHVEELLQKIIELEKEKETELEENKTFLDKLRSEMNSRDQSFKSELQNFERRYSESREEISKLNSLLFSKDEEIQKIRLDFNNEKRRTKSLKNKEEFTIEFGSGKMIEQRIDSNGNLYYRDRTNGQTLSSKKVDKLLNEGNYRKYPL